MVTIIGRGHGGTRAMSHTLTQSGYFMGAKINNSGDLIPAQDMYDACRIFGNYVTYKGNCEWDFSKVLSMDPTPEFISLVNRFLKSVLESDNPLKGWKLPETVLCFPWILKMFPDIKYISRKGVRPIFIIILLERMIPMTSSTQSSSVRPHSSVEVLCLSYINIICIFYYA